MMREAGTVKKVLGDELQIRIDEQRPEVCAKCRACEVLGKGGNLVLRVKSEGSYRAGQRVTVDVPDVSPWHGIVWVLGLPIAMLVAGMLLGANWPWWQNLVHLDAELAGTLLGVIVGSGTFMIARMVERHYACRITVQPLGAQSEGAASFNPDDLEEHE